MRKKCMLTFTILLFMNLDQVHAIERVVVASAPSETAQRNVYLMADKKTWMDYENFVIQIGDLDGTLYHFPDWYHGKYEPKLIVEDVSGDQLDDIVIVLNSAGIPNFPDNDLHVLNFNEKQGFQEVKIESFHKTQKNIQTKVKLEKSNNIVTIHIEDKSYSINITEYNKINPREPFNIAYVFTDYYVKNGMLVGAIPIYITTDTVTGSIIGYLKLEYKWNAKAQEYGVNQIIFIKKDDKLFAYEMKK
ncbi:hypothetical protein CIB95_04085 [Lottiidibacillus patelloidae]|uniref:Uncharacterized protein n=1 Tax=Lottiidibacillus patelloidae TaxID=2670334 RepID=A0A263BV13_9BACI|nr:hypothetical protein [Lottiidibacillus patelloidae]OZM57559.1 hypothetical protein CIB95_04085 [Lottiidibacillus patelloidae]